MGNVNITVLYLDRLTRIFGVSPKDLLDLDFSVAEDEEFEAFAVGRRGNAALD